jgi:hypothetical protein
LFTLAIIAAFFPPKMQARLPLCDSSGPLKNNFFSCFIWVCIFKVKYCLHLRLLLHFCCRKPKKITFLCSFGNTTNNYFPLLNSSRHFKVKYCLHLRLLLHFCRRKHKKDYLSMTLWIMQQTTVFLCFTRVCIFKVKQYLHLRLLLSFAAESTRKISFPCSFGTQKQLFPIALLE